MPEVTPIGQTQYKKEHNTWWWFTELKNRYNDALLLFKVGNAYEAYYEDAVVLKKICGLESYPPENRTDAHHRLHSSPGKRRLHSKITYGGRSMTNQQLDVLKQAIETYGIIPQLDMAIEEMAELTQAISKFKRTKVSNARVSESRSIIEETADVIIMIEQIIIMLNRTEEVEAVIAEKVERLYNKLNEPAKQPPEPETRVRDIDPTGCPYGRLQRYDDALCIGCSKMHVCWAGGEPAVKLKDCPVCKVHPHTVTNEEETEACVFCPVCGCSVVCATLPEAIATWNKIAEEAKCQD